VAFSFVAVMGATAVVSAADAAPARPIERAVLVLGDSLSAEYGLPRGSGWVALLEQRLKDDGLSFRVVNASISGDTTSGGRSRLGALLRQHHPQVVVLELGGNDALRGLPLTMTRDNLRVMASEAKATGARVLIVGMAVPPNYGKQYGAEFVKLFAEAARAEGAALVPFLLAGVADVPEADKLFQGDGIHPLAQAHPRMLANVWPVLRPLLR
jgi:acyl-CoA thioesterase-1